MPTLTLSLALRLRHQKKAHLGGPLLQSSFRNCTKELPFLVASLSNSSDCQSHPSYPCGLWWCSVPTQNPATRLSKGMYPRVWPRYCRQPRWSAVGEARTTHMVLQLLSSSLPRFSSNVVQATEPLSCSWPQDVLTSGRELLFVPF